MNNVEILEKANQYYLEFKKWVDVNRSYVDISRAAQDFVQYYRKNYIVLSKYYNYFPSARRWKDRIIFKDEGIGIDCFERNGVQYPSKSGLYLIGQVNINPRTGEQYYWIKVGWGNNLALRRKQYSTYTAMIWDIGYYIDQDLDEEKCHNRLLGIALHRHANEWFSIPRQDYLKICQIGFDWFKEEA